MRSFLRYLSTRTKYCVPLRKLVALNVPESIIGVEQGKLFVAAVPHVPGKISYAVFCLKKKTMWVGTYVVRTFVPKVFGELVFAHDAKAGSANVSVWYPAAWEARNG